MRVRRRIITLLFLFSTICGSAQFMDSIRAAVKHKPKFMFRFDSRNSFIRNQNVKFSGLQFGLDYNHTFRIGVGFHGLNSGPNVSQPWYVPNRQNPEDTLIGVLKFDYIGFFVEYVFYKTRKWEFATPITLGFGGTQFDVHDNLDHPPLMEGIKANGVLHLEADVTAQYKIIPWFGFGTGVGYRQMLVNNPEIRIKLSSPIYIFKVKVFIGDLYRSIFNKQPKIHHGNKEENLEQDKD